MDHLSIIEIVIRMLLSIIIGGVIGFEREHKNRPAGLRTHILVCLGATILALIQQEICVDAIQTAIQMPKVSGVIRADPARLIAQVVSGVGFLGVGTIIVTKHSVKGLTTAASLWAVAGLGLALGMGYYQIGILGFLAIYFSLTVIKKYLKVPTVKKLEVRYKHRVETKEYINQYFEKHNIYLEDVMFDVELVGEDRVYRNIFTVDLPKSMTYADLIEELSMYKNITKIRLIAIV
jgi:putative Mg2+ transporter-C (MgtC) family protein